MFRRIESESLPTALPKDWTEQFKKTLLNIYGDKCLRDNRTFEVFAFTYPEEVLLIVSYSDLDPYISPISVFLSCDLTASIAPKKSLDTLCDSVGMFYDHYFANSTDTEDAFDEFVHDWEEEELNGLKFFYKITRENISLTLEANKLLESI